MPPRQAMKGVLQNFLGTYTSRYSDHGGYWLFGFLVHDLRELSLELAPSSPTPGAEGPLAVAARLAAEKFAEQVRKGGFDPARVREARLILTRQPAEVERSDSGVTRLGHEVRFGARAVLDDGGRYEATLTVFVAPHDPRVEHRSTRHQ